MVLAPIVKPEVIRADFSELANESAFSGLLLIAESTNAPARLLVKLRLRFCVKALAVWLVARPFTTRVVRGLAKPGRRKTSREGLPVLLKEASLIDLLSLGKQSILVIKYLNK